MLETIIDLIKGKKVLTLKVQDNLFYNAHYKNKYNGCHVYYLKLKSLEKHFTKIKTLILGSSHGVYGYVPNNAEFNLCFASQDLYYSLNLYKKYRLKCLNLNKIFLFYGIFSPGFELSESSEKWRCIYYKMFFDIKSSQKKVDILSKILINKLKNKINKICSKIDVPDVYYGENIDADGLCTFKNNTEYTASKRALDHLKHNVRNSNAHKYLIELVKLIKDDKREFYVIIPPMHEELRKWLPSEEVLFNELYNISCSENFKIINLYNDTSFTNADFFDFDHLNSSGAEKLTKKVHEQVAS